MHADLFAQNQGVADQENIVQLFPVHVYCGDLVIVVGRVIIDSLVGIAAGSIACDFVIAVSQPAAAAALFHSAENVKKLADAFRLAASGNGIQFGKAGPDEPGLGGQISGQTYGPHTPAAGLQTDFGGKGILGFSGRQVHEIAEVKQLVVKSGIVCQDTHRILVDVQSIFHGFHRDAALLIRNDPVQGRRRKAAAESGVRQVDAFQQAFCLGDISALGKNPGDEFEAGNVVLSGAGLAVPGVAHKIQTGHGKALFVHGIEVQGIVIQHMGHANHGIMMRQRAPVPKRKRKVPGRDGHFLGIGNIIIQRPAKIKVLGLIGNCRAHGKPPDGGLYQYGTLLEKYTAVFEGC